MQSIDQAAREIIEQNAVAIATLNPNGTPHQAGIAYLKVVADDQIIITDNFLEETAKNIKNNPACSLVTWRKDWETDCLGYSLEGTAEYIDAGKWLDFVKKMPENEGLPAKGAILFTFKSIKKIT